MEKTQKRPSNKLASMMAKFRMLAMMFSLSGMEGNKADRKAYHQTFMGGGSAEFIPRKHTIMSCAEQKR